MDLVLSVNTAYLACIVIVSLFVIYKLSVNPKTWFLPLHHFFDFKLTVDSEQHCFPPRIHSGLWKMSSFGLRGYRGTSDT